MTRSRSTALSMLLILFAALMHASEGDEKSLHQERSEKIAYGIDSEIIELIDTLIREKEERYASELLDLYRTTINDSLKQKIVAYFGDLEIDDAVDTFFTDLESIWDSGTAENLIIVLLGYLKPRQSAEITGFIAENLVPERSERVSIAAVAAVGASGREEYAPVLLDELEEGDLSPNKRAELISAVGLLGDENSVEMLAELLLDENEDASIRWRAASALGEIGGDASLDALISVFSSSDPILRSRAAAALGRFDDGKAETALLQALRDSFWRVRVAAAGALGERGAKEATGILIYKASNDPDIRNVRVAALRALGKIGTGEAQEYLYNTYLSESALLPIRMEALRALLEADSGKALAAVKKLFDQEIDGKENGVITETAKLLSTEKSGSLEELYSRMLSLSGQRDMVIYALNGIRINKLTGMKQQVERLTGEDTDQVIRRHATSTLEALEE